MVDAEMQQLNTSQYSEARSRLESIEDPRPENQTIDPGRQQAGATKPITSQTGSQRDPDIRKGNDQDTETEFSTGNE